MASLLGGGLGAFVGGAATAARDDIARQRNSRHERMLEERKNTEWRAREVITSGSTEKAAVSLSDRQRILQEERVTKQKDADLKLHSEKRDSDADDAKSRRGEKIVHNTGRLTSELGLSDGDAAIWAAWMAGGKRVGERTVVHVRKLIRDQKQQTNFDKKLQTLSPEQQNDFAGMSANDFHKEYMFIPDTTRKSGNKAVRVSLREAGIRAAATSDPDALRSARQKFFKEAMLGLGTNKSRVTEGKFGWEFSSVGPEGKVTKTRTLQPSDPYIRALSKEIQKISDADPSRAAIDVGVQAIENIGTLEEFEKGAPDPATDAPTQGTPEMNSKLNASVQIAENIDYESRTIDGADLSLQSLISLLDNIKNNSTHLSHKQKLLIKPVADDVYNLIETMQEEESVENADSNLTAMEERLKRKTRSGQTEAAIASQKAPLAKGKATVQSRAKRIEETYK